MRNVDFLLQAVNSEYKLACKRLNKHTHTIPHRNTQQRAVGVGLLLLLLQEEEGRIQQDLGLLKRSYLYYMADYCVFNGETN